MHFPVITNDGLRAATDATSGSFNLKIMGLSLGGGCYSPDKAQTQLKEPFAGYEFIPIVDFEREEKSNRISFRVVLDREDDELKIGEIGFIAEGSDSRKFLLAVMSRPENPLNIKLKGKRLSLNTTITLNQFPSDKLSVGGFQISRDSSLLLEFAKMGNVVLKLQKEITILSSRLNSLEKGIS